MTTADQVRALTLTELNQIHAAYAERLFREVELPALKASFANVDEKAAKEIVNDHKANRTKPKTIRDKAFEILAKGITPWHLLDEPEAVDKPRVEPLPGISASAARGIVQAVQQGLPHELWVQIAGVYEQIRVAAGDREP